MGWVTFWAIFSQTRLVTLALAQSHKAELDPKTEKIGPDPGLPMTKQNGDGGGGGGHTFQSGQVIKLPIQR
jgi:hypothetical protein